MSAEQSFLGQEVRFPIGPFYELEDARTYLRTKSKIIALCVVRSKFGKELKLYQWEWRGDQKGWKVGLANLRIESLNLEKVVEDAKELASKHNIVLKWR